MIYGRMFKVRAAATVSAALDALELRPAAEKPIIVHRIVLSPTNSEVNQQIQVTIRTLGITVTSGSGGSAPTTGGVSSHVATSAFVAEAFNTTRASTNGTTVYHCDEGFPSQGGFEYNPDVNARPIVYNGEALIVGIEESLGGMPLSVYADIEEI